eukprot:CAMPEP_0113910160 /NCGR_PEP_ID=MMETSP0780_2-20120614/27341_1 /TAXON_ID=652834 /ORGANISM="Palpitomonas bilix" /LENGTH=330 /DNA_ID=CAMNT_0000906225 /DNA_START=1 /DNA_END=993 /DNA_ORIENTATION=- /assembly_acc=CAM_ASM_000599
MQVEQRSAGSGDGGSIQISAGSTTSSDANSDGGSFTLTAGTSNSGAGGGFTLFGGGGENQGGGFTFTGGNADAGNGGGVSLTGGEGTGGDGGSIILSAGESDQSRAANVTINGGASSASSASGGYVLLNGGDATAATGTGGAIVLTGGASNGGAAPAQLTVGAKGSVVIGGTELDTHYGLDIRAGGSSRSTAAFVKLGSSAAASNAFSGIDLWDDSDEFWSMKHSDTSSFLLQRNTVGSGSPSAPDATLTPITVAADALDGLLYLSSSSLIIGGNTATDAMYILDVQGQSHFDSAPVIGSDRRLKVDIETSLLLNLELHGCGSTTKDRET